MTHRDTDIQKYASHVDYSDGSYNFDSSDDLEELIKAMNTDFENNTDITAVYVGESGYDGLLHAEHDPLWMRTRELEDKLKQLEDTRYWKDKIADEHKWDHEAETAYERHAELGHLEDIDEHNQ